MIFTGIFYERIFQEQSSGQLRQKFNPANAKEGGSGLNPNGPLNPYRGS